MKNLLKLYNKSLLWWFICIISIVGLFILLIVIMSKPNTTEQVTKSILVGEDVVCPTTSNFPSLWNSWSQQFLVDNPGATAENQTNEWNDLMIGIGCPEWVNPHENATDGGSVSDYE